MNSAQRILVVEDEAAIADNILYALRTEGLDPLWAATGADALEALSTQRAQAVLEQLVARGVESSRLEAQGLGSQREAAPNTDAAGREQNRRVELVIVSRGP